MAQIGYHPGDKDTNTPEFWTYKGKVYYNKDDIPYAGEIFADEFGKEAGRRYGQFRDIKRRKLGSVFGHDILLAGGEDIHQGAMFGMRKLGQAWNYIKNSKYETGRVTDLNTGEVTSVGTRTFGAQLVRGVEGAANIADKGFEWGSDKVSMYTGLDPRLARVLTEGTFDIVTGAVAAKAVKTAKTAAQIKRLKQTGAAIEVQDILSDGRKAFAYSDEVIQSQNPIIEALNVNKTKQRRLNKLDKQLKLDRRSASTVLGGQNKEARIWYEKLQLQVQGADRKISKASTHHMNQLMQQAKAIAEHPNGDAILKALRGKGIPMGDDITNYTTILDINPKHLKIARVDEARKLYPNVPKNTLDDAFGGSEFSKQPLLKPDEIADRELWQVVKKETGLTNPYGEFKPGSKQGPFPEIKLYDKNKKVVRRWKAETIEQWEDRWNVINDHYGSNIDPKKLTKIKINPELATYAPDHDFLHNEILNKLPSHKRLKELTKSGKWANLPESEAIELLEQVSKDSIRSSHKVSKFRYGKISEYYEKFRLNSQIPDKFKKMKWDELPTDIQHQYFKENASKLSSYGSRDISNINKIKFKDLTDKEKAFFGIK